LIYIKKLNNSKQNRSGWVMNKRSCIFNLREGEVIISYPEKISAESCLFLNEFISIFMRILRRQTEETEQKQVSDENT
jgi:hypothetical protein